MNDERMKRQAWLEQKMIGLGVARYYERMAKAEDESRAGQRVIKSMIPPTSKAIAEWVADGTSGRAGRDVGAAQFVSQFDPDDLAYLTCRLLIGRGFEFQQNGLTRAATTLARTLEDATNCEAFRLREPKAWARLQNKLEKAKYPGRRHILFKTGVGKLGIKTIKWDNNTRVRVGTALLVLACEATGAFQIVTVYRQGISTTILTPAPSTTSWLEEEHSRCSLMEPHYLPMVVPPKPWTTPFNGGYHDRGLKLKLVSSNRVGSAYFEELKTAKMPMVYEAINAVQSTPWRINKAVLRVLRAAWDSGSGVGKLPPADNLPLPVAPWGEGEPPSDDAVREHKARMARTHEANESFVSKRFQMQRKLWIAGEMENDSEFYFPHTLDWRGRMYPVVAGLNPQADDTGRALLEFANGHALGEEGAFWLAVHGANSFGIDKVTFEERVEWVEQHQDDILDSAVRPLEGDKFWTQAEDPYTFLAFCMEWAGLMSWVATGRPQEEFVSHLPVGMDGSCNGLQNFSAMLRDPVGGKATNLMPQDQPADIYTEVANAASVIVDRDAAGGEVNAVYWKGKVTRKYAKRPTMTLPYGSGQFGFGAQIRSELQKHKLETGTSYITGDEFLCSQYLGKVLYDALGSVVVKALEAMGWLKEVSRVAASEGLPVWWTTPVGLPVMQDYREVIGRVVDFTVMGTRYNLTIAVNGDKIDRRKQAQGIAPNFVHSLDAAHLARTVALCRDEGIDHFAMVHDSYGVHAGRVADMNRLLRRAFIVQYTQPVLANFRQEVLAQVSEKKHEEVPAVPPMGDLDLEGVAASEYFFA